MSTDKDNTSSDSFDKQFVLLTAKKERLFSRMNDLFSLSTNISNYASRNNEAFMTKSEPIDVMRCQFETIIDDLNDHQLSLDSSFKPDYKPLDAFDDLYLRVKHTRNRIMEVLRSDQSSSRNDSSNSNIGCNIKLPPIELPSFDGKTQNWPKFYESFKSNIHNNNQLTDSQRVQYLVGKLTHDALKVTAGIVPTGETYNIIWESLVKKFQDKRALGTHYLNNILDSKGCISTSNSLDTFIGMYTSSVAALKQLGIEDLSDFILFHCALRKIDSQTVQAFELVFRNKEIPSYNDLVSFVQDQAKILQRSSNNNSARASNSGASASKPSTNQSSRPQTYKSFVASNEGVPTTSPTKSCEFCNKTDHLIYSCSQFKDLSSPRARFEFIKSKHGCVNCLSGSHTVTSCKSTHVCGVCKKKHHTYLHFDKKDHNIRSNNYVQVSQLPNSQESFTSPVVPSRASCGQADINMDSCVMKNSSADNSAPVSPEMRIDNPNHNVDVNHTIPSLSLSAEVRPTSSILLSTAQVYAKSQNGNKIMIRCLIDNGSQNNLITIDCCKALNLVIIPLSNSFVKGIGSASRPILGYVNLDIESRVYPNNKYSIHALVVDCITDQLPTHYITKGDIGYLEGLPLADLTWNIPGNVDVVLGAQLFPYIYLGNKVESGTSAPPALLTAFGFVLMGDYPCSESQNKVSKTSFSALALNDLVQKFWQLEEIPNMQFLSPEETECENLFASSVTRADDGRYSVALPFSKDPSALGNSRTAAQRRLMALERKFKQSPDLQEIYSNVLNEYIDNGYLSQVAESDITDEGYYIPHHAVTHPDKPMPRIVLDASAATHTGLSLNDVLHTGPNFIIQKFSAFIQEFPLISSLKIPRHVGVLRDSTVLIVAFCDASMNGYGCVIYLHTTDPAGNITVRLLCAKSKVSPTKVTTLARLELCAAVLMSKLIRTVHETYRARHPIAGTYAFSDSTIALSWIHSSPHRWSVFVSNRVAQCQENLPPGNYYHVAGCENPSDCLSRGMLPSQLLSHDLWWNGPSWMQSPPSEWPVKPFTPSNAGQLPELRAKVLTATVHCEPLILNELAQRVSSWDKLLRIVVYILRFIKKVSPSSGIVNNLMTAEKAMIRSVQRVHFAEDIKALNKDKLPSKKLQSLFVFLDEDGLLRIGGRLSNSDLPFEAKHPLLLPKHDPVVDLLIDHSHIMNCHTGPGLLISILRQRFWILDARTVVRARVRKCNYCFRVNPSHPTPMMADLPSYRVSEAKAFVHTGVDYAGPLRITLTRRRGQHSQKAYICLFVCLVTKAIHIELVSELTSDAFLAAFKRFISRRGPVSCLYSDNGTNFVGAKAQLDDVFKILIDSEFQSALKQELSARRIEWKMIPPRSPHFGGIWEGNIKSLKTHLHRVIGNQLLTYEELLTVLVQIECIMNSRPLTVVSSDPSPEVITPAHFLMSTPLQYLPAVDLKDVRINLVQRKQLLDSMVQSYWKKWRLEYLHTLQVRQKWTSPDRRIEVGTVVLVGQDDCPPLSWPLGVITEIHPGSDKVVRVATVKTKCGIFKRPVVKLYPIPTQ
ncbi:hypothetical protein ABMA27_015058 [Loxostege sticticalis]|uniref:Integrase catalytic domain-containing protein n=1 Tax=Loxostege sticticalis TaxID=481309 RepID=A0ABR3I6A4_LOXSC